MGNFEIEKQTWIVLRNAGKVRFLLLVIQNSTLIKIKLRLRIL